MVVFQALANDYEMLILPLMNADDLSALGRDQHFLTTNNAT